MHHQAAGVVRNAKVQNKNSVKGYRAVTTICYIQNTVHVIYALHTTQHFIIRRGYIYGAIKGRREAMFTAAVKSLDGAKPSTNPIR